MTQSFKEQLKTILLMCCVWMAGLALLPVGIFCLLFKRKWEREASQKFLKINPPFDFEIEIFLDTVDTLIINKMNVNWIEVEAQMRYHVCGFEFPEAFKSLLVEMETPEETFKRDWPLIDGFYDQYKNSGFHTHVKYHHQHQELKVEIHWLPIVSLYPLVSLWNFYQRLERKAYNA